MLNRPVRLNAAVPNVMSRRNRRRVRHWINSFMVILLDRAGCWAGAEYDRQHAPAMLIDIDESKGSVLGIALYAFNSCLQTCGLRGQRRWIKEYHRFLRSWLFSSVISSPLFISSNLKTKLLVPWARRPDNSTVQVLGLKSVGASNPSSSFLNKTLLLSFSTTRAKGGDFFPPM